TASEAGVAQNTRIAEVVLGGTAFENIDTVSLTAPSSGYVIVIASMQLKAVHTATVEDHATIDVSATSAALRDPNNTKNYLLDANATPGTYVIVTSVQRAFPVSAGAHTFYLVANEVGGDIRIDDVTITAFFVPTAYGTVEEIG
ncbi:MAG: hypothetical protein ACE5E8_12005, partial [Acidimicrobiia bacterium]